MYNKVGFYTLGGLITYFWMRATGRGNLHKYALYAAACEKRAALQLPHGARLHPTYASSARGVRLLPPTHSYSSHT